MIRVAIEEVEQRFGELLSAARAGEVVEFQQDGDTFRITAVLPRARPPLTGVPKAGRLKGKLLVPDDFDQPLEDLREYME